MSRLEPFPAMVLRLGKAYFEFVPHPLWKHDTDAIYVIEGGEALIYQLRHVDSGILYALKVFKAAYRDEHINWIYMYLFRHAPLPGMSLDYRICITRQRFSELIETFPELEYAVLMPWYEDSTWSRMFLDQQACAQYTLVHARTLALATAQVLWGLESHHMAHTDIAGSNILFSADYKQVHLLDLENMYIPTMPPPKKYSQGSPGYRHRGPGERGQWCPQGDRFAAAILLVEMLTWWEPRVRAHVPDEAETLFLPTELQVTGSPTWRIVREVLYGLGPSLLALFDQAWTSNSLFECPDLGTWTMALLSEFA